MDRKLHLDLLRARGAADRLELSQAIRDLSARLAPLVRAAAALESAGRTLRERGSLLGWLATVLAALGRRYWMRGVVSGITARQLSKFPPWARLVGTAVMMGLAMILRARRPRPRGAATD